MKIVLLTLAVLIVGLIVWYWRKDRRLFAKDLAELYQTVLDVVARIQHSQQSLLKKIVKCDSIQTIDGREQRIVWIEVEGFKLFVSKETKRPRVWVRLRRGEDVIEMICRSNSKLGKSADSLFASIDRCSNPLSEDAKLAMQKQVEILREMRASDRVIASAEKTAESYGVSVSKQSK